MKPAIIKPAATGERPRILLVEDEPEIRHFIHKALDNTVYHVIETGSVAEARNQVSIHVPDLVILDLGLPGEDGLDFIHAFRPTCTAPVLVLSARLAEHDKIAALDAGADDYLTKPFTLGELLARIRALLRRSQLPGIETRATFSFSDVTVDLLANTISRSGEPVHLTQIEYQLLTLLLNNAGKVLTHRFLLREVWGANAVESGHYLRIYVSHLRQKLEADPTQPKHLLTETGIGYRFVI